MITYILIFILVLSVPLLIIGFIIWAFYCSLVLPSENEYGRTEQSKAYKLRQQVKKASKK